MKILLFLRILMLQYFIENSLNICGGKFITTGYIMMFRLKVLIRLVLALMVLTMILTVKLICTMKDVRKLNSFKYGNN